MRSGAIGNNATTVMSLDMNLSSPTTVSFMYKVSSEEGWDYLRFRTDNVMMDESSGEIDWPASSYEMPAGNYTFQCSY